MPPVNTKAGERLTFSDLGGKKALLASHAETEGMWGAKVILDFFLPASLDKLSQSTSQAAFSAR